jgi:acetyltransferase-like isoleucine patch superfamily enzyme
LFKILIKWQSALFCRFWLFVFNNAIPNFYWLKIVKCFVLKLSGFTFGLKSAYVVTPLYCDIPLQVSIGKGVFINSGVRFEGKGKITIGDNVQIGPGVIFATTNHELGTMKTSVGEIEIAENVWIGAGAIILPNVKVGPNTIVAAGTVVNKSFKNALIAGVPAKIVKSTNAEDKPA